jgi:hypothetical protein
LKFSFLITSIRFLAAPTPYSILVGNSKLKLLNKFMANLPFGAFYSVSVSAHHGTQFSGFWSRLGCARRRLA